MKTIKLMKCALCAAVLVAFGLVACEKVDLYTVDAPADLQHRIDSIEAAKPNTGDTTFITITAAIVGPEDNSAGWWAYFSDYFAIPANKLLHMEFVNHGTGVNNWNNWNLAVTNEIADRDGEGYKEYFVLRSDAYGWAGTMAADGYLFDLSMITQDYPDTDEDGDIWNDFRTTMQGAYVTIEVDHSASGYVFVTATAVGLNGTVLTQTYQQEVSATADIVAFLIADGSHFEMKKAYLIPSKAVVEPEETVEEVTYRAEMTATITTTSDIVYTYTYFAEGLPFGGYGSFLITDGGHMVMDPAGTYYSALSDTSNSAAWFYPYSVATTVGLEDNSTPWWTAFSNYTTVVGEGNFHYKFVNYTSGVNNWNNWVLALTNGQSRSSLSYKEGFIIRADNYGWGTYYLGSNLTNNYNWDTFLTDMNGATVEISLTVSEMGSAMLKSARAKVSKALKPGETIEKHFVD